MLAAPVGSILAAGKNFLKTLKVRILHSHQFRSVAQFQLDVNMERFKQVCVPLTGSF